LIKTNAKTAVGCALTIRVFATKDCASAMSVKISSAGRNLTSSISSNYICRIIEKP
jgi:hypothetical protein